MTKLYFERTSSIIIIESIDNVKEKLSYLNPNPETFVHFTRENGESFWVNKDRIVYFEESTNEF